MRTCVAACVLLFALRAPSPLGAREFRVELFSGHSLGALELRAGAAEVRMCSSRRASACLVLKPGHAARCAPQAGALKCSVPEAARTWSRVFVMSRGIFRAVPQFGSSSGKTPSRGAGFRELELVPAASGLRAIAAVDLETYVAGALAGEATTLPSPAAREAMAIVARTWALSARGRHRTEGFDFCALTHCQAFRWPRAGSTEDDPPIDPAVRRTDGQVLEYGGRLIDPYFSANCGGTTESAGEVWPDRAQPYLVSVRDPYCAAHEQSSWQRVLELEAVMTVLRDDLHIGLIGALGDLRIERKDPSGRAHTLRASGAASGLVDANAFRYAVNRRFGWNTLKSNLYTVERRGRGLVFTGRGLGHGVGLCQAGAEQMARMGIPAQQILATYFPGTTIVAFKGDDPVVSSEHFELAYPEGQQAWVDETLESLERFRAHLGQRAEGLPPKVRVQTWETTEEFIGATGQPGWAAASNDGQTISLQPLGRLKRKGILASTLRHELAHLVVHRLRAVGTPRWFEEGMALYLSGERVPGGDAPLTPRRSLDDALAQPRSESEMKSAYARALTQIRELARRQGEAALWRMLERPTPDDRRALRDAK